jgi:hypothetical protein
MNGPRLCIFTGLRSRHKLEITKDKHSWTRAVPCSKAYLICREDRRYRDALLRIEPSLIASFYEHELDNVLGGALFTYEESVFVKDNQRSIKDIIGREIAYYEAMDDISFEEALNLAMEKRLSGIF